MTYMDYQVILQYRIEFNTDGSIKDRPKLIKGFIPKHLDAKKDKEVIRVLKVTTGESMEI